MHYQDFTVVNVGNKDIAKSNTRARMHTEIVKRSIKTGARDVDRESNPLQLVTGELRTKIIQARTLYNSGAKIGLTREELAKKISQPTHDIKLLETGKLQLKDAKQIAIRIERALNVKIL